MLTPETLAAHWKLVAILCAISVSISLCLIANLWIRRRSDSLGRKLSWSIILLVPVIGWLFYAAFYHPPEASGVPASTEHSAHIS